MYQPNILYGIDDNLPKLKRTHAIYYQVHGQLGVCSLEFCDFLVSAKMGLLIDGYSLKLILGMM